MKRVWRFAVVATMTALFTCAGTSFAVAAGLTADEIATNVEAQLDLEDTAQYRISVREIGGDGRSFDIGGHDELEPASAIKVFFAWLALKRVDEGTLNLKSSVSPGLSWRTCLRLMIEVSDNYCAADIRVALGDEWINRQLNSAGFDDTSIQLSGSGVYEGKRTSTVDLADLFVRLESGELLSATQSAYFHKLLASQVWRTRIHAGVPAGIVVESKPGILAVRSGMVNSDVAIVRAASTTYVIAVIGDHDATRRGIARLSRIVYEGLTGESDYIAATYPLAQFVARTGTRFAREFDGPTVKRLASPMAIELHHTEWDRAFVTIRGIGDGWVDWSNLHLAEAYRWRG